MTTGTAPSKVLREAVHELNNLCATILGFASLGEELEQNGAVKAYLAEIRLASEGIAVVARQLRELSHELDASGGST
jgi:signal transduction histidine kinase